MIETLKSGGIWMIPIIACAVIATFIVIERCIYFSTVKRRDKKLMKNVRSDFAKQNFDAVVADCKIASTPTAMVIEKAVECRNLSEESLKDAVQTQMDIVVPKYEHLLAALATIANISTLLGLLGTVTGNIRAFSVLSGGSSDPAALAGAIAEALVTTAAGLIVSIPSIVFHSVFVSRVNHRISQMEADVTEVIFKLTGKKL